jgi:hypothetical protein
MPRIDIVLTFDYELYLGRNFLPDDDILFRPTERLFQLGEQLSLPLTFFPDVCSAWAHRQFGLDDFAQRFDAQMVEVARCGHDVQLHITSPLAALAPPRRRMDRRSAADVSA